VKRETKDNLTMIFFVLAFLSIPLIAACTTHSSTAATPSPIYDYRDLSIAITDESPELKIICETPISSTYYNIIPINTLSKQKVTYEIDEYRVVLTYNEIDFSEKDFLAKTFFAEKFSNFTKELSPYAGEKLYCRVTFRNSIHYSIYDQGSESKEYGYIHGEDMQLTCMYDGAKNISCEKDDIRKIYWSLFENTPYLYTEEITWDLPEKLR
jgi:hypothetical protein